METPAIESRMPGCGLPTCQDDDADGGIVPCVRKAQRHLPHRQRRECIALVWPVHHDLRGHRSGQLLSKLAASKLGITPGRGAHGSACKDIDAWHDAPARCRPHPPFGTAPPAASPAQRTAHPARLPAPLRLRHEPVHTTMTPRRRRRQGLPSAAASAAPRPQRLPYPEMHQLPTDLGGL